MQKNRLLGLILTTFGINLICISAVTSQHIARNVTSNTARMARDKALDTVARHVDSRSCWVKKSRTIPYKIGDSVLFPGTHTGQIPTTCVKVPRTGQYLEVAYLGSELQVIRSFSQTEIDRQLSIIKQGN